MRIALLRLCLTSLLACALSTAVAAQIQTYHFTSEVTDEVGTPLGDLELTVSPDGTTLTLRLDEPPGHALASVFTYDVVWYGNYFELWYTPFVWFPIEPVDPKAPVMGGHGWLDPFTGGLMNLDSGLNALLGAGVDLSSLPELHLSPVQITYL